MTIKFENQNRQNYMRLVVAGGNRVDIEKKEDDYISNENSQYELFSHPDGVLFSEARNLKFTDIKKLIYEYQIQHILDLREVPYLNFGSSNRTKFFNYLEQESVDYLSLVSIAAINKLSSAEEMINNLDDSDILVNEIIKWIGTGTTLVFIARDRDDDLSAKKLSEFLIKHKVSYSEISNNSV